jgi:hypothetical protein
VNQTAISRLSVGYEALTNAEPCDSFCIDAVFVSPVGELDEVVFFVGDEHRPRDEAFICRVKVEHDIALAVEVFQGLSELLGGHGLSNQQGGNGQ